MSPLEPFHRVLPNIEQAYDPNEIDAEDGSGAPKYTDQSQLPCSREGQYGGTDQDDGLKAAAAVVYFHCETTNGRAKNITENIDRAAEYLNQ